MNRHLPLLAALAASLGCIPSPLSAQTISKGNVVVDLENFAILPNSGSGNLPARASALLTAPDGRLFVNDQRGILYTISIDGATVTPYLDIRAYVPLLSDDGERGFQTFAFHPDFTTRGAAGYGKFYTVGSQSDTTVAATFTPGVSGAGRDHDEVLLEWTAANPAAPTFAPADPAHPFREVLRIARPNVNHDGGYLSFNPTATPGSAEATCLYYGMGDSGGSGDPLKLAQMPGNAYGAILRIDPLLPAADDPNRSANGQYRIPADNPYTANPALLREKYAGGFRNPQRFTWDAANGHFFITDIGQNNVEEIDLGAPGANYGWNRREGSLVYNGDGSVGANARSDAATTGFTYPVAEYRHFGSVGNAVTIGPVYRGYTLPGLTGRLVFCDFPTGTPYTLDADHLTDGGSDGITELRLRVGGVESSFLDLIKQTNPAATRADLRFGVDVAGNIYFLNKHDGIIRRAIPTASNETLSPVLSLDANRTSISRGAGQTATLTIHRSGDKSAPLVAHYVTGGAALGGQDYAPLRGTRKIRAGKDAATISIVPLPGGKNGKVRVVVPPGEGYVVDPDKRKVLIHITD